MPKSRSTQVGSRANTAQTQFRVGPLVEEEIATRAGLVDRVKEWLQDIHRWCRRLDVLHVVRCGDTVIPGAVSEAQLLANLDAIQHKLDEDIVTQPEAFTRRGARVEVALVSGRVTFARTSPLPLFIFESIDMANLPGKRSKSTTRSPSKCTRAWRASRSTVQRCGAFTPKTVDSLEALITCHSQTLGWC